MPAKKRKVRSRGFERPFSRDQLITFTLQPVGIATFYAIVGGFVADSDQLVLLLSVYSALFMVSTTCWVLCAGMDPAQPGGFGCPCFAEAQKQARYCSICKKTVAGLDHHCTWLNTCIGRRNYPQFYVLATTCSAMFTLQTAVFALLLTSWRSAEVDRRAVDVLGSEAAFTGVVATAAALSGCLALAYVSLWVFHTHLLVIGKGTYAWMLDRRAPRKPKKKTEKELEAERKREEALEARRQQEREDWVKAHSQKAVNKPKPSATVPFAGEETGNGAGDSPHSPLPLEVV